MSLIDSLADASEFPAEFPQINRRESIDSYEKSSPKNSRVTLTLEGLYYNRNPQTEHEVFREFTGKLLIRSRRHFEEMIQIAGNHQRVETVEQRLHL